MQLKIDYDNTSSPVKDSSLRTSTPIITGYQSPRLLADATIEDFEANDCADGVSERSTQSLSEYKRHEWLALFSVCYVNFASNASFSILTSFFGQEVWKSNGEWFSFMAICLSVSPSIV